MKKRTRKQGEWIDCVVERIAPVAVGSAPCQRAAAASDDGERDG